MLAVCTATDNGAGGEVGADWTDVDIGGRVGVCAIDWTVVETVERAGDGVSETVAGRAGVWGASRATVAVLFETAPVLIRGGGCALTRAGSDAGEVVLLRGFGGALLARRATGAVGLTKAGRTGSFDVGGCDAGATGAAARLTKS